MIICGDFPNIDKLTAKEKRNLIKEIADYGERAFRRGFQHGSLWGNEIDAEKLRHKIMNKIFEPYQVGEDDEMKIKLLARPLLSRMKQETTGPMIDKLLRETGEKYK